ncbi:hypothetical protein K450DRAFT_263160 [Umbelopsis ramanniana AG]|uniref:Enoyl reductase (ER) domain-containing protein n=1 Tax=Umbelopsis ramanniana AG TaxID=1314678 RepID=A0AAD5H7N3_UMBRA|nr:uncharacterized protein K450DRAFT_263160 [Umbelopsis ramanniana AG]KAI8575147.1 hypothetical protein K450DRAFT_263160 [Umbelopsis ramanniana AG]
MSMKAIQVKSPGAATDLYIGDYPKPSAGDSQILVKVKAFALNRMDLLQRKGLYPPPKGASNIMGVEVSGIVEEVGQNVKGFKVGDAVFGLLSGGGYAEYATIEQELAMHKPDNLSFEEAAAIPETWFTAYQGLFFVAGFKKGDDVLIHAGASGVGIAAIQIAKLFGANKIFVTVGSDDKVSFCEKVGATKGFNYKTGDWAKQLSEATNGQGVNVIIDPIGKNYFAQNLDSLAVDGHMVIIAFMSGNIVDKVDLGPMLRKRLRIEGSALRSRSLEYQARLRDEIEQHLVREHFAKPDHDHLRIFIDKVYNWNDVIESHKYLESDQSMGKIVLKIE